MAESGSSPNPEKDRPSSSRSPADSPAQRRHRILVIEDSKADLFLIRAAIEAAKIDAALDVVHDGHQAIEFIDKVDRASVPGPDLVLLDLNLPKKGGTEVLRYIRNSLACRNAVILVVTSSDSASDREAVNRLGFSGYFRKPSVYAEFMKLGPMVRELLTVADAGTAETT